MKKVMITVFFAMLSACQGYSCEELKEVNKDDHYVNIINSDGIKETLMLEEYIIGVVGGEMPALFNSEALKAQAIAARTYAMYRQGSELNVTDLNQVYLTSEQLQDKWGINFIKYYNKIYDVVIETSNMVIKYDDELIDALYFSSSNGHTENSEDVYKFKIPYLRSVEIQMDYYYEDNEYKINISDDILYNKLEINSFNFEILSKTAGNSVEKVLIGNKEFTGLYVRSVLGLRSQDFTMKKNDNIIEITTKGYGHQVGLSQWGSNFLANDGYSYQEILNYFYTNVEILKI